MVKALPLLGETPFFHLNADTMWIDGARSNLMRLTEAFDPARMDILLLMAPTASSIGYSGSGDYAMLPNGALRRRKRTRSCRSFMPAPPSCRPRCSPARRQESFR